MTILRLAVLATLLLGGCTSISPAVATQDQAELRSAFVRESAAFPHGDCIGSLDLQLTDVMSQLDQMGVSSKSNGVFLFFTGDSYLWVSALYAGRTDTGYRLIVSQPSEMGKAQTFNLSEAEYKAILKAANLASPAAPADSRRSHDPCEYLAIRQQGALSVRATRQALSTDSAGLENYGGFRLVRELMERALESRLRDSGT